ncbi:hypothetical protein [Gimesia panareensis]|uniref:hypothetical protein n=1 Tax=Gimesia panareensis TaxID=2527978 RepID=UPI001189317E|nr:hypothetical protein [Gimesia panareensis]QDU48665.1 hypothetical protein Pan110_09800 [Gimesia panareensis]
MNRIKLALVMLATLTHSSLLFAHPGHGTSQTANPHGILHYFTEPVHLIPFAAIAIFAASVVIGRKLLQRSRVQKQKATLPPERRK